VSFASKNTSTFTYTTQVKITLLRMSFIRAVSELKREREENKQEVPWFGNPDSGPDIQDTGTLSKKV
jgi:hypothetical protein